MVDRILIGLLLCNSAFAAGLPTTLANLPNTGINAIKVDSSGNIYIAGFQGNVDDAMPYNAFVAKLSPDGSTVLYSTTFAGGNEDNALALDIDSTGAAYIFGQTNSPKFPVTSGALQTTYLAGGGRAGFVAKVDPQGKVVYSTFLGETWEVDPSPGGLLVDSAGEAFISGRVQSAAAPSTFGAPFASINDAFVVKLDSTGSTLLGAVAGVGGIIASDSQGNIYIAGPYAGIPPTSGAFQTTVPNPDMYVCGGDAQVILSCSDQSVTKLNASLTQIAYSTLVTGSYGATPAAIGVDAQGDVFLAGTTSSSDYPTTPGAFQTLYLAAAPPPPCAGLGCFSPPPTTGYVTELNPTGTGLVYSTYLGGTQSDTITFAAFTADGAHVSGQSGSPDLPGFGVIPTECLALPETFVASFGPDGSLAAPASLIPGVTSANVLAYDPVNGTLLAWTGTQLISFSPSAPPPPISCIVDAADLRPVSSIAPGELLTLFGEYFEPSTGDGLNPGASSYPTSLLGSTVTFNGLAGPLLYVSPQQINVQAPFEIAGSTEANLVLNPGANVSDSRTLGVVATNPAVFLDTVTPQSTLASCPAYGQPYAGELLPLAFNSDGTRNNCFNPASPGSVVTIFLDGLGVTVPALVTGSINPSPAIPLNLPVYGGDVVSAVALPGSISGVWQVVLLQPSGATGAIQVSLSVGTLGNVVRDTIVIWVR